MIQHFSCSTRIAAGEGAISQLRSFGAQRVFLVADPFFVKNGGAQRVLSASGCRESACFDRVTPDPEASLAAEGTARLKEFAPDLLIGLGGGSALDLCKAMYYFSGMGCPLVAIPTTSGSGSEVTDFSILTCNGVKHPLIDEKLRPVLAILDSDFLQELPPALIADAGFDLISHAVEAAAGKNGGVITQMYSREAFRIAYGGLPASYAGQVAQRLKIHLASTLAGVAFNQAGLGLCHALSHALGGMFHVPHGRLNAVLLPGVMALNAPAAGEAYASLAHAAGIGGSVGSVALRNLKNSLCRLRRDLRLPETLPEAGIPPEKLWENMGALVSAVLADPCCDTNPVPVEDFMVRRLLEEAAGRG